MPGTSAEAVFASSQEVLVSRMSDSLLASGTELGRTPAPEWMNGLISCGSDFIPSYYVPERVQAVPSHQSCRIATLNSRADTVETIIGIIFARSKGGHFLRHQKKHNPVLRFQKMMAGMA